MSRIGKNPISIPSGVTVENKDNLITVKGPKGELKKQIHPKMKIEIKDNVLTVSRASDAKEDRELHGLSRTLISNMVIGVTKGFDKTLEIIGVGFKAKTSGRKITLNLGFSHPIEFEAPTGITLIMDEQTKNKITVQGADKEIVGSTASKIRSFRPPEPYKGKGIRYIDERVIRKAGKAAASAK